jgi:hypothetical protein
MTPGQTSALIYSTAAITAALLFFVATSLIGDYDWVARIGGSGWVFLLSMIILMPSVTPLVKRVLERAEEAKE